jgi:hypothetical protein
VVNKPGCTTVILAPLGEEAGAGTAPAGGTGGSAADETSRTNRTLSPGAQRAGLSSEASNIVSEVRPMSCHPPGESNG